MAANRFYKLLIFIFVLLSIGLTSLATNIDSLKACISDQKSSDLVPTLNTLAKLLLYEQPDESAGFSKQAISVAKIINDYEGLSIGHIYLGHYYIHNGIFDSAFLNYQTATNISRQHKLHSLHAKALSGLGDYYNRRMQFDSANLIIERAIEISKSNNLESQLPALYNSLAAIADSEGNYTKAIELFFEAEKYYQINGDVNNRAIVLNNIASVYMTQDKYVKAISFFDSAVSLNLNPTWLLWNSVCWIASIYKISGTLHIFSLPLACVCSLWPHIFD